MANISRYTSVKELKADLVLIACEKDFNDKKYREIIMKISSM